MKTGYSGKCKRIIGTFIILPLLILSCNKSDDGPLNNSLYSGSGNFEFSGDLNEAFTGTVENAAISQVNGVASFPISFKDSQGAELFIGLRNQAELTAHSYTLKDLVGEGYAAFYIGNQLYDTAALAGKGTVTLTTVNSKRIVGAVDMKLARALNTADTLIVKGSFELNSSN